MGTCQNCGTTSGNNQTCATKTSQLVWDGGSMCNGYSGSSLNNAILSLAQSICNLNSEWSSFTVSSDDIIYTTTSTVMTTVLDGLLSDVATLQSDLGALDGTLVIHYDNTTTTFASGSNVYGTLKSFSVPANTWEETFDYLIIEFVLTSERTDYGDMAQYRVKIGGATILNPYIEDGTSKSSTIGLRCQIMLARTSSNTLSGDYWVILDKGFTAMHSLYGDITSASPITFTNANTLLIEGFNETGAIACTSLRITKVKKTIQ